MTQYGQYPDTYYRVTLKAVIRDKSGRILMVKEASDQWDLPGGGWDHGEDLREAFARELVEEIDYQGDFKLEPLDVVPIFAQRLDACVLFLIYEIMLSEPYEPRVGQDSSEVAFIDPKEFLDSDSRVAEIINQCINQIGKQVRFSV